MMKAFRLMLGSCLFVCVLLLISGCGNSSVQIKSMYDGDTLMWEHIFASSPEVNFKNAPLGVIMPHHMIVAPEIAKFYKGLSKVIDPDVIVIISPNHYQNGDENIQTCQNCLYKTIDGELLLDKDLIDKMIKDGLAVAKDETFIKEHGISNHAPFIKRFFPNAKVVPIVLKWETSQEETVVLSKWLQNNLPKNSLVIASVDFSHYLPLEEANFHDISSYTTIKNFDYDNIYDLEIDSPPSISTITHLMEDFGYMYVQRFNHTNNQDYRSTPQVSTTSHQFIAFTNGQKQIEKSATILSFGNIATESSGGLGFYDNYRWNINSKNQKSEVSPYLRDIRGDEDRFLVGADYLVFDLPQNNCTMKDQNNLKISFCKFDQKDKINEQIKTIKKQKLDGANYVYLLYKFDDSKLSNADKNAVKKIINSGVDIFIGRGIKDSLPIEKIGTSIVAYSLGDFITLPTVQYSEGNILGIALSKNGIKTFLFPITIEKGYPKIFFETK